MDYNEVLKSEIEKLGYRVAFSSGKSNKSCHSPDYVVFLKDDKGIEQTYSIAHELGHCIDFKRGNLDFQRYRRDRKYRIEKEFVAWVYAFKVCTKNNITIKYKFFTHAWYCFKSYLKMQKNDFFNMFKCSLGIHKYTFGRKSLFDSTQYHFCENCGKNRTNETK